MYAIILYRPTILDVWYEQGFFLFLFFFVFLYEQDMSRVGNSSVLAQRPSCEIMHKINK